jgi:hypothetical protein
MSMIRRAAVGAVILGAGFASTAGVAMANDCSHDQGHGHGHSHSASGPGSSGHSSTCTNNLDLVNASKGGGLADVAGGAQTAIPANICDIANDNAVGNGNDVSLLGL